MFCAPCFYLALPCSSVSDDKHGMSDGEELLQLHHLQDEIVLCLQLQIQRGLLHQLLKVWGPLAGHVQGREQIRDQTHEDREVVRHDLGDVEVAEGTHEDLVFWTLLVSTFQGASHHEYGLDSA